MIEEDYIWASNIARVRAMKEILRQMSEGDKVDSGVDTGIPVAEHREMMAQLRVWEDRLEARINHD